MFTPDVRVDKPVINHSVGVCVCVFRIQDIELEYVNLKLYNQKQVVILGPVFVMSL